MHIKVLFDPRLKGQVNILACSFRRSLRNLDLFRNRKSHLINIIIIQLIVFEENMEKY